MCKRTHAVHWCWSLFLWKFVDYSIPTLCLFLFRWPVVLIGPSGSGKSSLLHSLARLADFPLHEFSLTSSVDSTELLGCFEQVDLSRRSQKVCYVLCQCVGMHTLESVSLFFDIFFIVCPRFPRKHKSRGNLLTMWKSISGGCRVWYSDADFIKLFCFRMLFAMFSCHKTLGYVCKNF